MAAERMVKIVTGTISSMSAESCLLRVCRRGLHFSTMLSRFTGKRGALPAQGLRTAENKSSGSGLRASRTPIERHATWAGSLGSNQVKL